MTPFIGIRNSGLVHVTDSRPNGSHPKPPRKRRRRQAGAGKIGGCLNEGLRSTCCLVSLTFVLVTYRNFSYSKFKGSRNSSLANYYNRCNFSE